MKSPGNHNMNDVAFQDSHATAEGVARVSEIFLYTGSISLHMLEFRSAKFEQPF